MSEAGKHTSGVAIDDLDERSSKKSCQGSPTGLAKYIYKLRSDTPSYSSKESVIAACQHDYLVGYELAIATPIQDLRSLSSRLLMYDDSITFVRDQQGFIIKIIGETAITGTKLERLLINYGAGVSGFAKVCYQDKADSGDYSGLCVPKNNVIDYFFKKKVVPGGDEDDEGVKGKTLYMKNAVIHLLLRQSDVNHFVALQNISLLRLPAVLKCVSNVRKVDYQIDLTPLVDLGSISDARVGTSDRMMVALLDTLEASFLEQATMDEKIATFARNPSFGFQQKLKFKRPFSKALFRPDGKSVNPVPLSQLAGDSQVLLQDLGLDANYWDNKFKFDLPVFVQGDYRLKQGKILTVLKTQDTMSVNQLRSIIDAKEKAKVTPHKVVPPTATSVPPAINEATSEEFDFDI